MQGTVWSNHDSGLGLADVVHARLAHGSRVVTDPAEADLFFLPLDVVRTCDHAVYARPQKCGVDYSLYADFDRFWRWLSEQPTWQASDGSNHFVVMSTTWRYVHGHRRPVRSSPHLPKSPPEASPAPALLCSYPSPGSKPVSLAH